MEKEPFIKIKRALKSKTTYEDLATLRKYNKETLNNVNILENSPEMKKAIGIQLLLQKLNQD